MLLALKFYRNKVIESNIANHKNIISIKANKVDCKLKNSIGHNELTSEFNEVLFFLVKQSGTEMKNHISKEEPARFRNR